MIAAERFNGGPRSSWRQHVIADGVPARHPPMLNAMLIAIDGPAGAGKSTVARAVADALGFTYLDSGAMYRCVALAALREGVDLADGPFVGRIATNLRIRLAPGRAELDGEDGTPRVREP